jgi:hypothetical protein
MDAPKGRYRVEEKDGRLVVIDNQTGAPASSSPPPRPSRAGGPGLPAAPIVAGKGALDSLADMLVTLAAQGWDGEGRAVIRWEWTQNGKTRRWDARLDQGQQRRLGRALLGLCAAPLLVPLFIFAPAVLIWLGLILIVPPALWGLSTIVSLQSETGGQPPPGD